ncbi:anterior gradient 1 [Centropristis striata]|uniref:anterior gradient 1 n=1 Tax=Centropristis striata TaxID=184440 RepID=UPI0027DF6C7B|nr:anterior gradient 1 [Centropristis striata]
MKEGFGLQMFVASCREGQEVMLRWVLFALFLGICANAAEQKKKKAAGKQQSFARGWGESITWVKTYEEGLSEMVKKHKPLMVIHHQEDCPHCQALKKAFVASKPIQKMAKEDFIMLNLLEETTDKNQAPDGYYVPRILFVDPSKTVRTDIMGKYSNYHYTYEPEDIKELAENMKKAKKLMKDEL